MYTKYHYTKPPLTIPKRLKRGENEENIAPQNKVQNSEPN